MKWKRRKLELELVKRHPSIGEGLKLALKSQTNHFRVILQYFIEITLANAPSHSLYCTAGTSAHDDDLLLDYTTLYITYSTNAVVSHT
jgi:hypothetical protein